MRTTVNINLELYHRLKKASDDLLLSTNDIIAILMRKAINADFFKAKAFEPVCYQKRDPEKNWHQLHITFTPQLYETGLDSRKFFKYSVSFVVAFAIIHFLDLIIEELIKFKEKRKNMDNYPSSYIFIIKEFENFQGFMIIKGIPEIEHVVSYIPEA